MSNLLHIELIDLLKKLDYEGLNQEETERIKELLERTLNHL